MIPVVMGVLKVAGMVFTAGAGAGAIGGAALHRKFPNGADMLLDGAKGTIAMACHAVGAVSNGIEKAMRGQEVRAHTVVNPPKTTPASREVDPPRIGG